MRRWHRSGLKGVLLLGVAAVACGAESGPGVRTLQGHGSSVMAVAFSPDGTVLASSSRDKSIQLWETRTGELKQSLTGHAADVYSVVYSPQGDLLASGSGDKTARRWPQVVEAVTLPSGCGI